MLNKNAIIQSLWIGTELSPMEQMCIKSYLKNDHAFHLFTYGPVANVPNGTVIKNANEVLDKQEIYIDSFGGYVNLSNLFRYKLLAQRGGWWVDMDTLCLKHFDFDDDHVFSSERAEPLKRKLVNTTFIKTLAGDPFLTDCIEFTTTRGPEYLHWGELGVNLISRMIFRNGLQNFIKSPDTFCPVSVYYLNNLVENEFHLPNRSYALHWWNELWKRKGLDKNATYPQQSLYTQFRNKYCK